MAELKVVFEDENLLIIDKPSGITVNRSDTTSGEDTLQDLIDKSGKIDNSNQEQEFIDRSGIVHRLDKETSGVMIVAKNSESFRALQAEFKERVVKKTYVALAHGIIAPSSGEIKVPVGRLPWNRKRFGVLSGGREALTEYETIKTYDNPVSGEALTLVRLFPKTGRTHQIRVHLKYINHPIFGDPLYSGRKTARGDRKQLERVFLHANSIEFLDPKSGEKRYFESDLPKELSDLLEKLNARSDN